MAFFWIHVLRSVRAASCCDIIVAFWASPGWLIAVAWDCCHFDLLKSLDVVINVVFWACLDPYWMRLWRHRGFQSPVCSGPAQIARWCCHRCHAYGPVSLISMHSPSFAITILPFKHLAHQSRSPFPMFVFDYWPINTFSLSLCNVLLSHLCTRYWSRLPRLAPSLRDAPLF